MVQHHIGIRADPRNTPVDLHGEGFGGQLKTIDPDKTNPAGFGCQRGELTACSLPVAVKLAHQRQAEADILQPKANGISRATVEAGKGIHAHATNGQHPGFDQRWRTRHVRVVGQIAVVQVEALVFLLDGKTAGHLEETEHVQRHVGRSPQQLPLLTVHGQLQAAFRSGQHLDRGLAACGDVFRVTQGVIDDHIARLACAVDLQTDGVSRHGQPVDTDKGNAGGAGLQAGPVAGLVRGVAKQRQAEVKAGKLKTNGLVSAAVHAGKGSQIVATDQQAGRLGSTAITQRQVIRCALTGQPELTGDLHKAEHVQRQSAARFEQIATTAIHVQRKAAAWPGEHAQVGCTSGVVDQAAIGGLPVDIDAQRGNLNLKSVHADKTGAADTGLQRGPTARGFGAVCSKTLALKGQRKADILRRQTNRVALPTIDADKGAQACPANQELIDLHRCR